MAALRERVEARAAEAETVGNALATLELLVPSWQIPTVVADPVAAGNFGAAVESAKEAERWIKSASDAQAELPDLNALESIKSDFESARTLQDLQTGAETAAKQATAASWVHRAQRRAAEPRDMLTDFGLAGVDVDAIVDQALAAAIAGKVTEAVDLSTEAIAKLDGASSGGSLRLAGIIFFGVAVLGVIGLWIILRRQAGPSWARSSKPHWIEDERKIPLLGRGRKKDDGKKKK